jgi:hypothetical protein
LIALVVAGLYGREHDRLRNVSALREQESTLAPQ